MSNKAAMLAIRRWTTEELIYVLQQNGFERACDQIKRKAIDGSSFVDMKEFNISALKLSKKMAGELLCFVNYINSNPEKFVKITDDRPPPTQQTNSRKNSIQSRNHPTFPSQNPNPHFNSPPPSNGYNSDQYLNMDPPPLPKQYPGTQNTNMNHTTSYNQNFNTLPSSNAYPGTQNANVNRQIPQNLHTARQNANTNQKDLPNVSASSNTYPRGRNTNFNPVNPIPSTLHQVKPQVKPKNIYPNQNSFNGAGPPNIPRTSSFQERQITMAKQLSIGQMNKPMVFTKPNIANKVTPLPPASIPNINIPQMYHDVDEELYEEQPFCDYEIPTPEVPATRPNQKIEEEEESFYEAEPMVVHELEDYLLPNPPFKNHSESSTDGNMKIIDRPLPTIPVPITPMSVRSPSPVNLHQGMVNANNPWFKQVSRSQAEILILNKPNGAFLFRPSTQPGSECTLTLIYNNSPFHINVQKRSNGRFALGAEKFDEDTFASLFDLVESYEKKDITLFRKGFQTGSVRLIRNVV